MKKKLFALFLIVLMGYTLAKLLGVDFEPRSYKCVITKVEHTLSPYVDGNRKESVIELDEDNEEDACRMAYFHFYLTRAYYVQAMKKDNYIGDRPVSFKVMDNKGNEIIYDMTDKEIESVKTSVSGMTNLEIKEIDYPKY